MTTWPRTGEIAAKIVLGSNDGGHASFNFDTATCKRRRLMSLGPGQAMGPCSDARCTARRVRGPNRVIDNPGEDPLVPRTKARKRPASSRSPTNRRFGGG